MFKVGDEVVCVKTQSAGATVRGVDYIVEGVLRCKCSNEVLINVGIILGNMHVSVCFCDKPLSESIHWQGSSRFRKKQNHTYKNKTTANLASRIREEKGIERIIIKETV